jgi:hypothetical protein
MGMKGLDLSMPFSEQEVLETNKDFIRLCLGMESLNVCGVDTVTDETDVKRATMALPGEPSFRFHADNNEN